MCDIKNEKRRKAGGNEKEGRQMLKGEQERLEKCG